MATVSILFHEANSKQALAVAKELDIAGYKVIAGPSRLEGFDSYSLPKQYTGRKLAATILLMSNNFYRNYRNFFNTFADALNAERTNLYIASMDPDWNHIQDPAIQSLKKVSYFQELKNPFDNRSTELLAERIRRRVVGDPFKSSHMTMSHFESFLRASYDPVKKLIDVNELNGQVAFTIFDCTHTSSQQIERYLILYPRTSLEMTSSYLKENHPGYQSGCDKLYVVRSEPGQELSVLQSQNLISLFNGTPLRFETMVNNRRIMQEDPVRLLTEGDFLIDQNWLDGEDPTKTILTEDLIDHCVHDDLVGASQRRIVILNGEGGAGKTHSVRYLHDKLIEVGRNVFFLSAFDVSNANADTTIHSLYDIYLCSCKATDTKPLVNQEIFDLKFLVNDPVIIVDGLEEIITMMGNRFDVNSFFEDCKEKVSGEANGLVVITTRQSTWPNKVDEFVAEFTLEPFTLEQANQFFETAFNYDNARVSLAMRIHQELTATESLRPLICDLIQNELKDSTSLKEYQARVDRHEYKNITGIEDFLLSVLKREDKLGTQWPPEKTMKALSVFAKELVTGPIELNSAVLIMKQAFPEQTHLDIKESVKNFIFFKYQDNTNSLTIRYNFLQTIFLANYIFDSILNVEVEEFETKESIGIYGQFLVPGSDILDRIASRPIQTIPEEFFIYIEELIKDILSEKLRTKDNRSARIISSNLLFLRLAADSSIVNISDSTKIIKEIFGDQEGKVLSNVSLIKFSQDPNKNFKFDLSGCLVREGKFDGVVADKTLKVNSETIFDRCTFEDILFKTKKGKHKFWDATFNNIKKEDHEFETMRISNTKTLEKTQERKVTELKRFLRCFSAGGHNFGRNQRLEVLQGTFTPHLGHGVNSLIDILIDGGVLEFPDEGGRNSFQIISSRRTEVRKFVVDSIESATIKDLINKL